MSWKTAYRYIYYDGAPEPDDMELKPAETALSVIDIHNTYLKRPILTELSPEEQRSYHAWTPFHNRMHNIVIPNVRQLLAEFRKTGIECVFARIACRAKDGRDRSIRAGTICLKKHATVSRIVPLMSKPTCRENARFAASLAIATIWR